MNADKSRGLFLAVLFGVMGLTLLVMAWLMPANASDRIVAAVMGSAGLFGAAIRLPTLKQADRTEPEQVMVNPKVEKEV